MEIHALRATVTEQDLNDLAAVLVPKDVGVEDLHIQITPQGVVVKGEYPLLVTVSFETLWELGVRDGKVTARLARFKTLGMPMAVLKSVVMGVIASKARTEPWLEVEKDTILMDATRLLADEGLKARLNLKSVRCDSGVITIEAASATP